MSHVKLIGTMGNQTANLLEQLEFSAKLIGGGSFVIGTLLFAIELIQPNYKLVGFGFSFVGYTFLVNALLFIIVISCSALFRTKQKSLLKTAGLLLLNIPVTIIYLMILLSLNSF